MILKKWVVRVSGFNCSRTEMFNRSSSHGEKLFSCVCLCTLRASIHAML